MLLKTVTRMSVSSPILQMSLCSGAIIFIVLLGCLSSFLKGMNTLSEIFTVSLLPRYTAWSITSSEPSKVVFRLSCAFS